MTEKQHEAARRLFRWAIITKEKKTNDGQKRFVDDVFSLTFEFLSLDERRHIIEAIEGDKHAKAT